MDMPDAFFTSVRKDGWNPLLSSLPSVLFPLSIDIADLIACCIDCNDDIVISPSIDFRGRTYEGIMETLWMMHREEGNTKGSISRDTGNNKPNVMRMDGEMSLATVIRYIRPMDPAVSDVFRRHDRRMEEMESSEVENPSDNHDSEDEE